MKKKILITGGGGYVGTLLVPELLKRNFNIIVVDTFWFGNFLPKNKNLKILKKNILDINKNDLKNVYCIIHLASIANDNSADLDPKYAWETSCLGTKILCDYAKENKVKKFIYASSGSVYGIKKEKKVTEKLSCKPVSVYNKTKIIAEKVIESYSSYFETIIVRPSTLYGYSPRMRLDITINILTLQAFKNNEITVFGGKQYRPYLHINDMVNFYVYCLQKKIKSGTYNLSHGNMSLKQTAEKIKSINQNQLKIKYLKSNDVRSYRLDSSKSLRTGFKLRANLEDEIKKLFNHFKNGYIKENASCYSINWIKKILN